jgi:hypothetical protein
MVRPHPGMDQRGTFVVYEELVELELRLRLKSTDPVDPVGYLVHPCHQRLPLPRALPST